MHVSRTDSTGEGTAVLLASGTKKERKGRLTLPTVAQVKKKKTDSAQNARPPTHPCPEGGKIETFNALGKKTPPQT